tara:strand:- start:262 stop:477 length:216 start_codon:yes stop_codon:yes gene_type:complete
MWEFDPAITGQLGVLLSTFIIGNLSLRRHMDTKFSHINEALKDIREESKEQWSNIRAIDRKVATLEAKNEP